MSMIPSTESTYPHCASEISDNDNQDKPNSDAAQKAASRPVAPSAAGLAHPDDALPENVLASQGTPFVPAAVKAALENLLADLSPEAAGAALWDYLMSHPEASAQLRKSLVPHLRTYVSRWR